jgi:hypothetical protein
LSGANGEDPATLQISLAYVKLSAAQLENMERRLIAMLYVIWEAQGKQRKIIAAPTE